MEQVIDTMCYFSAVYLSIIICMSGMSLFIQMLVMNIYHIDPVPAIPPCLKRLMRCSRVLRTRPKKASVGCITQYTNPQEEMTEADSNANSTNKPTMHVDNRAVVQELKKITSHQRRRETDKALRAEWHLAANILDRICFFVFLGIHVILLLVALTLLPISEHISDSKWCDTLEVYRYVTGSAGRFKNTYGLLNPTALKISTLYKNFQFMGKIWTLWNSTQNILPIHWNMYIL